MKSYAHANDSDQVEVSCSRIDSIGIMTMKSRIWKSSYNVLDVTRR